jgi:hypothetical protein
MDTEEDFSHQINMGESAAVNKPPVTAASIMDIINTQNKQVFSNQTNKKPES